MSPLTYASGPYRESTRTAGASFLRGDLLQYDASSNLSGLDVLLPVGQTVGVALADSTESLNGQVPYLILQRDTVLWSDITTVASAVTPGARVDLEYSGGFRVGNSANSALFIVDANGAQADVVGSEASRVRGVIDPDYLAFRS